MRTSRGSGGKNRHSSALKMLRGSTTGLNLEEPVSPDGPVTKPGWLSKGAGEVWDRLAPIAITMGTVTAADVMAFGTMCELQTALEHAVRKGEDVIVLRIGNALRPYYGMFGLEPTSRSRIHVKRDEPVSKWDRALA